MNTDEKMYQELLEQMPDGVFISDSTGRYVLANEKGCHMLGYRREEILQLSVRDLLAPEDADVIPIRFDELRTGKVILSERHLVHKSGARVFVEISAKMLADGQIQGIVRDITERKRLEQNTAELAAIVR